jgi:predicted RNase H-like HicB family nuclease
MLIAQNQSVSLRAVRKLGRKSPRLVLLSHLETKREDLRPTQGNILTQNRDFRAHALATISAVTIEMERDPDTGSFVTFVKELHGMSTFADTEFDALEMTSEMIRGYIESMEGRGMKIRLPPDKLVEIKRIVGL